MTSVLSSTTSLCPECLKEVPGRYVERDGAVHLERDCPEHGEKTRKVWGSVEHCEWASKYSPDVDSDDHTKVNPDHACLAVVEVTCDCNLSCGEPTVRDDLPEIVECAASVGFEHIQVNTNGIAPAREDSYAERLEEAGVPSSLASPSVDNRGLGVF